MGWVGGGCRLAAGLVGIAKERPRGSSHGGTCSKAEVELGSGVLRLTMQTILLDATQWSCQSMAREAGATDSFVDRVWWSCSLKSTPSANHRGEHRSSVPGRTSVRRGASVWILRTTLLSSALTGRTRFRPWIERRRVRCPGEAEAGL